MKIVISIPFASLDNKNMQKTKGSILAYSLIILAMMFAIVGSMSAVSVLEKKSAGSSQSSMQAFQVADNGVQFALKKINSVINDSGKKITDAFSGTGFNCDDSTGVAIVKGNIDSDSEKSYTLTFFPEGGTTPIGSCGAYANTVGSINSVGSFKNTVRAVNVAIAAGGITEQIITDLTGIKVGGVAICGGNTSHGKEIASINKFCIDNEFKFGTLLDSGVTASSCTEYVNGSWSAPIVTPTVTIKTVKCIKY